MYSMLEATKGNLLVQNMTDLAQQRPFDDICRSLHGINTQQESSEYFSAVQI